MYRNILFLFRSAHDFQIDKKMLLKKTKNENACEDVCYTLMNLYIN